MLELLDVLEVMRRVLLCMLEAAEGELWLLEVPGGDELRAILYAGGCGGRLCLLGAL